MMIIPTQLADSSSGIGSLGLNGKAFIIQLITFVLAFLVLKKWAFEPIVKVMRRRRETIDKGVELGLQMQKEKVELEAKVEQTLHKARLEADGIISDAHDQGRQIIAEAEEGARGKAELIAKEAEERVKQTTARAWREVEKEFAGLVSEATEAIIEEKVDTKKDSELIDNFMKARSVSK